MSEDALQRYQAGLAAFGKAKRIAFFQEVMGHIRGKPTELLSFADIRARLRLNVENYRGIQDVSLNQIVGSVGRYHEFTRHFLPKRAAMEERWSRVYAQVLSLEGLPPIELYKVDDAYFVRDGNHRVSVARQLGATTIQAEVIELLTPIGFRPGLTPEEIDATVCYAEFLSQMRSMLPNLPPGTFKLTHPTAYNDLLGHIQLYRFVEDLASDVNLAQAASDWYNCVYTPVVESIRKYGILDQFFPNCTETDLYLWVTEHVRDCEEELMLQPEPLNDFLIGFLRENNIPLPAECYVVEGGI
jgi:hypothetical protein